MWMMEVMKAVVERRNIKQFKPDPVDRDQLMEWLQAASYAPNHRMAQPWEIVFIGPETRAKLNHKANFGDAPVVMAVLSKSASTAIDRDENLIAVSCFIQNFSLIAWEAGVGVRWTSIGWKPETHEILGVPEGNDVVGVLGVGYPAEVPQPKARTPMVEKVKYLP
jgi:nitroreductase